MRTRIIKLFSCVIVLCVLLSAATIPANALSWDGSTTGGGGGGSPAGPNGYAVRTTDDNCLGYRFSVVDKNGNTKNGAVIDVFRNTTYGNYEYGSAHKFYSKYNKKQLINNQNNSYSTGSTTSGCLKEVNMGFATSLPTTDGMGTWQNNKNNLNPVLYQLGISGGIGSLKNGDKVLVEPLYDVRLQGVYHSLTVTEIALYGKWLLGANSNGGSSSTSASWGFISSYTNRYYGGSSGYSGKVYVGQRVCPKYTFTSENSWTSYNNFTGNLYTFFYIIWLKANGVSDMTANDIGINQNASYSKYSSLYPYRVPDNSAGGNRIRFNLTSVWSSDTANTSQSTWIDNMTRALVKK